MVRFGTILIDKEARNFDLTSRILSELKTVPFRYVSSDEASARLRGDLTDSASLRFARNTLLVTRNAGSFVKPMNTDPGVNDFSRANACRFEVFQGCPLDCVYCFCQHYLSCHHTVVFANLEDAAFQMRSIADSRLVTGDIADSLVLGNISIFAHEYLSKIAPENCCIELRTKFLLPEKWTILSPERFQLDWSMTTLDQWRMNEPGTPSPPKRIKSAAKAANAGFKVGIRLDPLQPDRINKESYSELIQAIRDEMKPARPCSFTIGSYKMTYDLLETIRKRFPDNPLPGYEWTRCSDGKIRPFKPNRLYSYQTVYKLIRTFFPDIEIHVSMEPAFILNCFDR